MNAVNYGSDNATALTAAVGWIENLLLGSLATTLSILAIATLGMLMLAGHMPFRRGGRTVLACFILFGAGAIAHGLLGAATFVAGRAPVTISIPAYEAPPPAPAPAPSDPYEGAAIPVRPRAGLVK
ncbi:MAG: TrbC/VirB2 family protein [Novosphingobium sp.]